MLPARQTTLVTVLVDTQANTVKLVRTKIYSVFFWRLYHKSILQESTWKLSTRRDVLIIMLHGHSYNIFCLRDLSFYLSTRPFVLFVYATVRSSGVVTVNSA